MCGLQSTHRASPHSQRFSNPIDRRRPTRFMRTDTHPPLRSAIHAGSTTPDGKPLITRKRRSDLARRHLREPLVLLASLIGIHRAITSRRRRHDVELTPAVSSVIPRASLPTSSERPPTNLANSLVLYAGHCQRVAIGSEGSSSEARHLVRSHDWSNEFHAISDSCTNRARRPVAHESTYSDELTELERS